MYLSSIIFDITSFSKYTFFESKLSNLDFGDVKLAECDFSKAIMKNCVFFQLKGASKSEAKKFDLSNSIFEQTDLTGSLFVLCTLKKVYFRKEIQWVYFNWNKIKKAS